MAMQITIPNDLEALVEKRLASGSFATAEEVLRQALEAQDEEETWTDEEKRALDARIESSLAQAAEGKVYGPEAALKKLAGMRAFHLANGEE